MTHRKFLYKLFKWLGWPEQLWQGKGKRVGRRHLFSNRYFLVLHLRCFTKKFMWHFPSASTSVVRWAESRNLLGHQSHKKAKNRMRLFSVAFRNSFAIVGKESSPFGWQVRVQKGTVERTILEWCALRRTLESAALERRSWGILRTMLCK